MPSCAAMMPSSNRTSWGRRQGDRAGKSARRDSEPAPGSTATTPQQEYEEYDAPGDAHHGPHGNLAGISDSAAEYIAGQYQECAANGGGRKDSAEIIRLVRRGFCYLAFRGSNRLSRHPFGRCAAHQPPGRRHRDAQERQSCGVVGAGDRIFLHGFYLSKSITDYMVDAENKFRDNLHDIIF